MTFRRAPDVAPSYHSGLAFAIPRQAAMCVVPAMGMRECAFAEKRRGHPTRYSNKSMFEKFHGATRLSISRVAATLIISSNVCTRYS
jgi:hypothetical protein